jgi:hypothetical protein
MDKRKQAHPKDLGSKIVDGFALQNCLVVLPVLPLGEDVHGSKGDLILPAKPVKDIPTDGEEATGVVQASGGAMPTGSLWPRKADPALPILQHEKLAGANLADGTGRGGTKSCGNFRLLGLTGVERVIPRDHVAPPEEGGEAVEAGEVQGGRLR